MRNLSSESYRTSEPQSLRSTDPPNNRTSEPPNIRSAANTRRGAVGPERSRWIPAPVPSSCIVNGKRRKK
ncbi:MAG: hypothetical protein D6713_07490 [Deltaproteobacteria bacterium]|nr:MAG: hypothetical protein D6713_07490 [Deltaproteobacteria bacterium]